jgi:glycine dehydrogenase
MMRTNSGASRTNNKAKSLHDYKFWRHVGRVDNVFGDRNPVCSCVGMENCS